MRLATITAAIKKYESERIKWLGFVLSKLFTNPPEITELKKIVQYGKTNPDRNLTASEFEQVILQLLKIYSKTYLTDVTGDLYRMVGCENLFTNLDAHEFTLLEKLAKETNVDLSELKQSHKSAYKNTIATSGFGIYTHNGPPSDDSPPTNQSNFKPEHP